MIRSLIAILAVVGLTGAVAAQDVAPSAPQPPKELEAFMKPFEGTWRCVTKFAANALSPGSPAATARSTVKFKRDLDGFFYRGQYDVKEQKGVPFAIHGIFFIGWDPEAKGVVVTSVDNLGTAGFATGKIAGDTLSYSGEAFMMGKKMKVRESLGMKATNSWHRFEVDAGKGFVPFGEDTCKK
jgi:hypothetical protein